MSDTPNTAVTDGTPTETESHGIVATYDFRHPAQVNTDQLRTLENLHDHFARQLSSTFSASMRDVVDVDTAFIAQKTYADFITSLSNPSCSYQFMLGPTNGQAILDFSMPFVFSAVDRVFGGKGSSEGVDERQMSQIEMGVIAKFVKRVVENLEHTWHPILPVEISDIELETNPEFMDTTAAAEIVVVLGFEVNSPLASGLVSLCYPYLTLESILPLLGQQTHVRRGRREQEEATRRSRAALGPVKLPLTVEMARKRLPLADVDSLQVDDIICCDTQTTEPLILRVGGLPKFYVRPFATDNGRIAVKAVGKIPEALQPLANE